MHCFPVTEASQVAMARRLAGKLARELGFDEVGAGKAALLATEAATNLMKHATQGQLLLQPLPDGGMELLALDRGPGMRNVYECLRDGYSTAGSHGTGLGAITRLTTDWDIYSLPGVGTALLMRLQADPTLPPAFLSGARPRPAEAGWCEAGGVCVPKSGENVCGDAWTIVQHAGAVLLVVADGLGHGWHAAEAAQAAIRIAREFPLQPPAVLLERMHMALRSTRGAAVAIAALQVGGREVTFAGVGNVAATLLCFEKSQLLPSQNGIVGHRLPKVRSLTYPWSEQTLCVLHSDGLKTRWSLAPYPGLGRRHPGVVAGVLYRDFARGQDDVTVAVARQKTPEHDPPR